MSSIAERRAAIKKAAADRRSGRSRDRGQSPRIKPSHENIIVTIKRDSDGQLRHGAVPASSTVFELLSHLQLSTEEWHLRLGHEVPMNECLTVASRPILHATAADPTRIVAGVVASPLPRLL